MTRAHDREKKTPSTKISLGFAERLGQLGPKQKVRAIVMLEAGKARRELKSRHTKTARRVAIKSVRESVAEVLPHIDRILKRHQGKRLKSEIDALSAVPVITTPEGIDALTASEHVKAIFEDQTLVRVA